MRIPLSRQAAGWAGSVLLALAASSVGYSHELLAWGRRGQDCQPREYLEPHMPLLDISKGQNPRI